MKNLLLLFIPLISFGQITLQELLSIKSVADYNSIMIKNGFSPKKINDPKGIDFLYNPKYLNNKFAGCDISSAFNSNRNLSTGLFPSCRFAFSGENETYKNLVNKIKRECKISYINDGLKFYLCKDDAPPSELLNLANEFSQITKKVNNNYNVDFNHDITDVQIGFGKLESGLFLIYMVVMSTEDWIEGMLKHSEKAMRYMSFDERKKAIEIRTRLKKLL